MSILKVAIYITGKSHFILGTELWGSRYEELLRLVKSYSYNRYMGIAQIKAVYGSGTGPLQYRSRPERDTACQGKGKFGKLRGEKSCIVVYDSECEAHGPSATDTILSIIIAKVMIILFFMTFFDINLLTKNYI